MKKKFLIIITLLLAITLTGCKKEESKPKIVITIEDQEIMEKGSSYAFIIGKDSMKVEDYTNEEKALIARGLVDGGLFETTGSEMRKNFQKYFGKDQTVEFNDIPCFMDHNNESEQTLYIFNKETDKYEYNPNHPGHGGGGQATDQKLISNYSITIDGDTYYYDAKVLFYGPRVCGDIGGCNYGKLYKSYEDYKNKTNELLDIDNSKYTTSYDGPPTTDFESLLNDYEKEGTSYRFTFVKENDKLIFKEYEKQ